ncbi:MAG TPA: hypothetical protein VJ227_03215 [Patescibacteria group bacterium]|nr:hypothetical protein [Patescibacteria group bacterium]
MKWWLKALIAGVLVRLILMPITAHPDLWGHSFTAYFFAYKGELNIYDFLLNLSKTHPLVANYGVNDIFIYPPLSYFTLGIFRFLVRPLADANFIPWLMTNIGQFYNYPTLGWQLFLFKLPYLFVDVASAFLLAGLFDDIKKKKLAFALWMFNPVTIYATFMIGQLDILPVFFTILSCWLIKREKTGWGLFSLGIGAAYKMYPLLLIPPAAFILGRNFWGKLKLILIGLLPYVLTIAPYLGSKGFRAMVLFGPKETKMLFMKWPVTAAEGILPFILLLTVIYLIAYYYKKDRRVEIYFLSIILMLLSVTSYHPQWFLWVMPFIIYALVKYAFKYIEIVVVLLFCWLVITLLFEASLSYGLFTPVWHNLHNAPSLADSLAKATDVFQFKSILRSVFAGASLFYVYRLFREN